MSLSEPGVFSTQCDSKFDVIRLIKAAKMIFLIKFDAVFDIFHLIKPFTHDTHVKCIVRFVFIILIHKLMRFPFPSSACAVVRSAASHWSRSASVAMKGRSHCGRKLVAGV